MKKLPVDLVRMMDEHPEIDETQRTITARVATRRLASDGGIVLPTGISTKFYDQNPVVLARHGFTGGAQSPVIGRCLSVEVDSTGMIARTQFADSELGREYAYLYGLNEKREVYMRAWSFAWDHVQVDWLDVAAARAFLGAEWDEDMWQAVLRQREAYDEEVGDFVWVGKRTLMKEYSAVPIGADRSALTTALRSGIRAAGTVLGTIDFEETRAELVRIEEENVKNDNALRMVRAFRQELKALQGDDADAALRGDSSALLLEVKATRAQLVSQ